MERRERSRSPITDVRVRYNERITEKVQQTAQDCDQDDEIEEYHVTETGELQRINVMKEVEIPRFKLSNPYIKFKINGIEVSACVDSGATRTIMSNTYFHQYFKEFANKLTKSHIKLRSASNHKIDVIGEFMATFEFLNGKVRILHPIIIYENTKEEMLLGNDFTFKRFNNILGQYLEVDQLPKIEENRIAIFYKRKSVPVYSIHKTNIPPHSACKIRCRQRKSEIEEDLSHKDVFVEDNGIGRESKHIIEPTCSTGNGMGEVFCMISNITDNYLMVDAHTYVGRATPIIGETTLDDNSIDEEDQVCQIVHVHDNIHENPLSQEYINGININKVSRVTDYQNKKEEEYLLKGTPHGGLASPPGFDGIAFEQFNPVKDADVSHLSPERQAIVKRLIQKYLPAFAKSESDIGKTDILTHKIDVEGQEPIAQHYRPVAKHYQEPVEKMIKELLALGVIMEAKQTSWASNIIVVKKRDTGKIRICCDLRGPNSVSNNKSVYPIQHTEVSFGTIAGAKYITAIDLLAAYWTIKMETSSIPVTAFYGPNAKHYQWTRMPFGLAGAPHTYSEVMSKILRGTEGYVYNYFDDVLIYSNSFEDHMKHIESVIDRFLDAGFKINTKKCKWVCSGEKPIEWLGTIVRNGCVLSSQEKVKVILELPKPKNVLE